MNQSSDNININVYHLWKIIAGGKSVVIGLFTISIISTTIVSLLMPKIYRGEALLNVLQYETMQTKEMVQTKEIVEAKEIVDMIGHLDREKRNKIFPGTSVMDLRIKPIKDSKDKILITIDAKNIKEIDKALSELVAYINNFEIVRMTVSEEREKLSKRSVELSAVINSSASLSNTYRKLLNEGKLLPVGFNPVDLNKRIADIKLEKLSVDQRLQRLNSGGIEIAKRPYIYNKPVKPKIMFNVTLAAIGSILIGFFLVLLEDRIKNV